MFERGRGPRGKQGKILWPFIHTVHFQTDPCDYLSIYLPPFPTTFLFFPDFTCLDLVSGRKEGRRLEKKLIYARFVFACISEAWIGLLLDRGFLQLI